MHEQPFDIRSVNMDTSLLENRLRAIVYLYSVISYMSKGAISSEDKQTRERELTTLENESIAIQKLIRDYKNAHNKALEASRCPVNKLFNKSIQQICFPNKTTDLIPSNSNSLNSSSNDATKNVAANSEKKGKIRLDQTIKFVQFETKIDLSSVNINISRSVETFTMQHSNGDSFTYSAIISSLGHNSDLNYIGIFSEEEHRAFKPVEWEEISARGIRTSTTLNPLLQMLVQIEYSLTPCSRFIYPFKNSAGNNITLGCNVKDLLEDPTSTIFSLSRENEKKEITGLRELYLRLQNI